MTQVLLRGFTREFLLSRYSYDPTTGLVKCRVAIGLNGRYAADSTVGYTDERGYIRLSIKNTTVHLHRLIWFMQTGEIPPQIDHEDLNKSNNKWSNLRAATQHQNQGNREKRCDNASGFKGVCFEKQRGAWRVNICSSLNKTRMVGRYDSLFFAAAIYNYEAVKTFGPFARINDIPGVGKLCVEPDSIGLYL